MVDTPYEVRPLDESRWPAVAALVEASNGIFGGCWCIPPGWRIACNAGTRVDLT